MHAIEEWKVALDNGQHVGVVLMDLIKDFDTTPHGLLLTILYTYGTSKDACNMIRSYLINRMQRGKLDDVKSSWKCIVCGLPQGSQACPCVFNIFLNDLFYFLEALCQTTNYVLHPLTMTSI